MLLPLTQARLRWIQLKHQHHSQINFAGKENCPKWASIKRLNDIKRNQERNVHQIVFFQSVLI